MENLTTAITSLTDMAGTMLTTVLANPVLALCFASGFVGVIISVIHSMKNA